ncbi:MAG: N-acetyltransferase [SAR86 cluster bacterium]|uniref:N-acetyltransferase n=1 Tax=SAR86 cluster bacterium TaxID=2030880 RepID=A0A2A5CGP9_9GAMM|nr:N-acetyltransferase [bacterium AH-315-I11]MBN4075849.1 N-acetyltransferase [Gammaproteobacteria bacterium AH-315-E17]PCJ42566.1 MAG: N-acetyltransferase [SAR86 cluster bacterium]
MIKPAGPEHYDAIIGIYNQAVLTGLQTADTGEVTVEDKRDWLALHDGEHYSIYVACEDEKVVGYLALSPYRHGRAAFHHTAEISYYLDAQFQGQGIGSTLIEHAISQCSALEIESLVAILLSCNTTSVALLEKFGFKRWGLMPNIANLKIGKVDHYYYGKELHYGN